MNSYFQVRNAGHTAWFASQEVRNIADVAAMVTKVLDAAGGERETSVQALTDHGEASLRPVSADRFSAQVQSLFREPPGKLLAELNLKDDTFCCASWVPWEEHYTAVSGMISRLLGVYELTMVERPAKRLDLDRFCNEVWDRLHTNFVVPRMERQSEQQGPRNRPETGRDTLYKRVTDLVATYEELLLVPDETCVTHCLGDLGVHIFKYDAAQEQIQSAYEKALSVMEMGDAEFQAEKQFVCRGEIISTVRDRLLVGELKPGEIVLFVGAEPYGGPGDFELQGRVMETMNPLERTCSIRDEFFTIRDVPLHYVLDRYDTSVEGEHCGFPHVRPLFRESRDLAGQYLREAEASWNIQQAETQIDAPQTIQEEASKMQKAEITLSFDGEKLDALEFYLKRENTTIQKRMNETLTELYERIMPGAVRRFLDRKAPPPARPKRPARSSVEKPLGKVPRPEGQTTLKRDGATEWKTEKYICGWMSGGTAL